MRHAVERPEVAGISLSHADRVLFGGTGGTKLDLARYYESIADWVLPHLVDRPLTCAAEWECPPRVPAKASTASS